MSKTATTPTPTRPPTDHSELFKPAPKPAKAAPTPLADWLAKLRTALDVLKMPAKYLFRPSPDGESADDALQTLIDGFQQFRVAMDEIAPLQAAAKRFGSQHCGEAKRDQLVDLVVDLLQGLESSIGAQLAAGRRDHRVLRLEDFADHRRIGLPDGSGNTLVVYAAIVSSMAADHPLRAELEKRPTTDFYQLDLYMPAPAVDSVGKPSLILGAARRTVAGSMNVPLPFYFLADSWGWTATMRHAQREKLIEDRRRDRLEEEQRVREWWASPAGKALAAAKELERLRKIPGGIPTDPIYEPTVRGAGIRDNVPKPKEREETKSEAEK